MPSSIHKTISFIINPKAGARRNVDFNQLIEQVFSKTDFTFAIHTTKAANHATELAADAVKKNVAFVIAIGGDGTVNEVAKALVHSNSTLGIVPAGSGNGFARHLKIPLDAPAALKLIASGKIIRADSFTLNNIFSVNVSGVGFEAHVAHLFSKAAGRGFINYARLSLREFLKYKPFKIQLVFDGEKTEKEIISLSIANSSQYGNNARIAPFASVIDEQLDICMMKKFPLIGGISFGWKMMNGLAHQSRYLEIRRCKNLSILSEKTLPFHIDGEPTGFAKEVMVKINPASLNVLVPVTTYKL